MSTKVSKSYTPEFYVQKDQTTHVSKGALQTRYDEKSVGITASGASVNFSGIDPPVDSVLSRNFELTAYMRLDLVSFDSGTGANAPDFSKFFPRSNCLNRAIDSIKLTLNNINITSAISDNLDCINYYDSTLQDRQLNFMNDEIDKIQDYEEFAGSILSPGNFSNVNARKFEVMSIFKEADGKLAATAPVTVNDTHGVTSVVLKITENIRLPLLKYRYMDQEEISGFYNISQVSMNLNFFTGDELMKRMIGTELADTEYAPIGMSSVQDDVKLLTNSRLLFCSNTGSVTGNPNLYLRLKYTTPDVVALNKLLPARDQKAFYEYEYLQEKARQHVILPGVSYTPVIGADGKSNFNTESGTDVSFNNFILGVMPSKIFIYGKLRDSEKRLTDADAYARILSINVVLANDTANFSTAKYQDLYKIMVKNGFKYEYGKFTLIRKPINSIGAGGAGDTGYMINTGMGTVLKLFAHDFNLPADLGESVVANLNMTVKIKVKALHSGTANRTYDFVVITSNKTMLGTSYTSSVDQAVMVSKNELLNAGTATSAVIPSKQLTGGKRLGGKSSGGKEITLKGLENML